jgi:DNA-binding NarL/FixJ family response regulator
MIMSPIDRLGRATPQPAAQRTVLVIDDHPVIRDALNVLIGRLPNWRLVAEASRARDGLGLVSSMVPDVVVMDLALPGMDGVIATREVLRRSPNTKVLILTAHLHPHEVREAFLAGATGYLL